MDIEGPVDRFAVLTVAHDVDGAHRSIIWAKLKCLAEGAAIASKVLWH